ncbi:MAG: hypothetical protein FWG16_06980, partial [Micrococcales bacterium]|nr:hypothetical protein [Micrococcales bacterium]
MPEITYPLLPGKSSPSPEPEPTEEAPPEATDEASPEATDEAEATPTPTPSPYINPPTDLQVMVVGSEGTGDVVGPQDIVSVSFIAWTWGNTEPLYTQNTFFSYQPFVFSLQPSYVIGVLSRIVVGQHLGSRVLAVVPPAMAELNVNLGAEAGTTTVVMMDIEQKWSQSIEAQADAVPTGVQTGPQIKGALGQEASVSIPGSAVAPEEFTVQVLATGTGPNVAVGDTVLLHYAGMNWNGVSAGSTWQAGNGPIPMTVPNNTTEQITIWASLVGLPVGSRVLVTVPAKDGANPAGAVVIDLVTQVAELPGRPEIAEESNPVEPAETTPAEPGDEPAEPGDEPAEPGDEPAEPGD